MNDWTEFQAAAKEAFNKLGLSKDAKFIGICIKGSDIYFLYKISSLTRESFWAEGASIWERIKSSNK
ncbi:MAG: hypothetical protein WAV16_01595 [Candidatus Moraniibacteriota bacterium]